MPTAANVMAWRSADGSSFSMHRKPDPKCARVAGPGSRSRINNLASVFLRDIDHAKLDTEGGGRLLDPAGDGIAGFGAGKHDDRPCAVVTNLTLQKLEFENVLGDLLQLGSM